MVLRAVLDNGLHIPTDRMMIPGIEARGHAHARVEFGVPVDPAGLEVIRNDSKATLAAKKGAAS